MKLPEGVLRHVRGPLLAAAVAGCSSSPATPPEAPPLAPEPMEPVTTAPDPVDYDPATEADRLARVDRALAAAEHRREARIEDENEARRGTLESVPSIGVGPSHWLHEIHAACGRG